MSITKSEALVLLAWKTGVSDGEFSSEEIQSALMKTPIFHKAFTDAKSTNWVSKVESGELNEASAITLIKQLPKDEQIEALAICLGIILADGVITDEERTYLATISIEIGITDVNEIVKKYEEMLCDFSG